MLTDSLHDATPQLRGALDGVTVAVAHAQHAATRRCSSLLAHAKSVTRCWPSAPGRSTSWSTTATSCSPRSTSGVPALSSADRRDRRCLAADFRLRRRQPQGVRPGAEQAQPGAGQPQRAPRLHHRGAQAAAHRTPPRWARWSAPDPDSTSTSTACRPAPTGSDAVRLRLPAGQAARQPRRLPARVHLRSAGSSGRSHHDQTRIASAAQGLRYATVIALVAVLVGGAVRRLYRSGRRAAAQRRRLLHLGRRALPRRRGPHPRRPGRRDRLDRTAAVRRQDHHVGVRATSRSPRTPRP